MFFVAGEVLEVVGVSPCRGKENVRVFIVVIFDLEISRSNDCEFNRKPGSLAFPIHSCAQVVEQRSDSVGSPARYVFFVCIVHLKFRRAVIDHSVTSINYLFPSLWCPRKDGLADILDEIELLSVIKVASFEMVAYQGIFLVSIEWW